MSGESEVVCRFLMLGCYACGGVKQFYSKIRCGSNYMKRRLVFILYKDRKYICSFKYVLWEYGSQHLYIIYNDSAFKDSGSCNKIVV